LRRTTLLEAQIQRGRLSSGGKWPRLPHVEQGANMGRRRRARARNETTRADWFGRCGGVAFPGACRFATPGPQVTVTSTRRRKGGGPAGLRRRAIRGRPARARLCRGRNLSHPGVLRGWAHRSCAYVGRGPRRRGRRKPILAIRSTQFVAAMERGIFRRQTVGQARAEAGDHRSRDHRRPSRSSALNTV
jgi:hypothetical protein